MKPSDFQKTVQCRFESCLKKVVRHVVKDYQQGLKRRIDKEIPFCELPEIVVEKLAVWDEYESDYTVFDVCGIEIRVLDDELADALKVLSEKDRNIVLMYFFLGMSDAEIGDKMKIDRSTSFRIRKSSLDKIGKKLKENTTSGLSPRRVSDSRFSASGERGLTMTEKSLSWRVHPLGGYSARGGGASDGPPAPSIIRRRKRI